MEELAETSAGPCAAGAGNKDFIKAGAPLRTRPVINISLYEANNMRNTFCSISLARGLSAACLVIAAATTSGSAFPANDEAMETLQLDHGPRATTTPWANAQRRLRNEQRKARSQAAARTTAQASAPSH
jgi:hypothetical protein